MNIDRSSPINGVHNHDRPLKILHLVDSFGVGGAETWLLELLRYWRREGRTAPENHFLATSGRMSLLDDEVLKLGGKIFYIPYGRATMAEFVKKFRRILKSSSYDAIHDHQDYASGWHFFVGAGLLPKIRVTHVHNPWLHIGVNYATSWTRRLTAIAGRYLVNRFATHVCGTSEEILKRYKFVQDLSSYPKIGALYCGFETERFNRRDQGDRQAVRQEFGWGADDAVVLFAGRLDRNLEIGHPQNHKNSWFALNVMRCAISKNPKLRLIMAGAGDETRLLMECHIREWGFEQQLRLVGVRADMPRLMAAADALFFPSAQEGLGMVSVEAQAARLPVVASSAVPKEAIVIPELFESVDLDEPMGRWADALARAIVKPRPTWEQCRLALLSSPFAIGNSARQLQAIYSSRAL